MAGENVDVSQVDSSTSMEALAGLLEGNAIESGNGEEGGEKQQQQAEKKQLEGEGKSDSTAASSSGQELEKHDDKEQNFAALRAKNREIANQLQAAQEEAERTRQELEALKQAERNKTDIALPTIAELDEQIKALKDQATELGDDAPALAATFFTNAEALEKMKATVSRIELDQRQRAENEEQKRLEAAKNETQAAIDATPVLKHWQTNDPDAFNLAADQDAILRTRPEWKGKPLAERFDAAVKATMALIPEASLPETPQPETKETKKPVVEAPAKQEKAPIASLSDLPGGLPPAKNEAEQAEDLSGAALQNRFMKMSREQQDAYLASLEL